MDAIASLHARTEAITGPVHWHNDGTRGLCACPGAAWHTSPTKPTDCTVFIEGAPTIFCFHATCLPVVTDANRRLRRALGGTAWQIILPDGSLLRSGDVRIPAGQPVPPPAPKRSTSEAIQADGEKRTLRDIALQMDALKGRIYESMAWDAAEMWEDSPVRLIGDPQCDFAVWLNLWNPDDVIWCGNTFDSGQSHHAGNFKAAADWRGIQPLGQFTCGSAFKPGSTSRSNTNAVRKFLVIESDTLTKDQMGAVFLYMTNRLRYTLHAVVDTGGKSLHGWFNLPADAVQEARLKAALVAMGCDPALFKPSQPARVPGATRDNGNAQSLLWCRP